MDMTEAGKGGRGIEKANAMTTTITVQYFDGCPYWKQADEELQEAIGTLGLDTEIVYERIESPEQAEEVGFRGSPTILISGRDPWAEPGVPIGLSCRVYRTGEKPSGSPGPEALRAALLMTARRP